MNADYKPTNIGKKTFEYFEKEATEEEKGKHGEVNQFSYPFILPIKKRRENNEHKKEFKRFHESIIGSSYVL